MKDSFSRGRNGSYGTWFIISLTGEGGVSAILKVLSSMTGLEFTRIFEIWED